MLRLHKKQTTLSDRFESTGTHAELFLARYEELLEWALKLTGDEQHASEIVHDAYIQFTLKSPELSQICNLNGYLWTMLRNLHISQVRRRIASPIRALTILDYDSAELGMGQINPIDWLEAQEQLLLICRYACQRKSRSKGGSVLILRFFLGYFHGEIAKILRCSRQAVDDRLCAMRREIMLVMTNSPRVAPAPKLPASPQLTGHPADAFLMELRRMIFASGEGDCPGRIQLHSFYNRPEPAAMESGLLAHVVSCERCLDQTGEILGLPPLNSRQPWDTVHPESGRGSGSSGGSPVVEA